MSKRRRWDGVWARAVNLDIRVTNGCVIIGIVGDPGAIALSI